MKIKNRWLLMTMARIQLQYETRAIIAQDGYLNERI